MKTTIRNCVVISDTHCGCQMGLCPPKRVRLDGGGHYDPSEMQVVLWNWWLEFWEQFVPRATKGEPYYLVLNGDAIDGVHHNATTQISHNLKDQRRIALNVLRPRVRKAEKFFCIGGTPVHSGESGVDEEEIAETLGAVPNSTGNYARYELWLRMGEHLVHFLHHVGTTSSSAHESSALNAELAAEFVEASRWGEKPPSVAVRSHRHRAMEIRLPAGNGYVTCVVTPAWQLKTPHCFKIAGVRLAPPQLGGVVIRLDDTGAIYTNTFVKHLTRDEPEN